MSNTGETAGPAASAAVEQSPTKCQEPSIRAKIRLTNELRRKFKFNGTEYRFRTTQYSIQGDRKYQEDQLLVYDDEEFMAFGVFDGHGGKEAAVYARDNLIENIQRQPGFLSESPSLMMEAITDGYLATQEAISEVADSWPKTGSGHRSTSGTTASIVIVDLRNAKLYTGHVGDSRIIIGSTLENRDLWDSTSLTKDHKPDNVDEFQRIMSHGGSVVVKLNVSRVVWKRSNQHGSVDKVPFLSIARSLGDLWSYNEETAEYVVSPQPDVDCYDLCGQFRCLILGSDGLFNMVPNLETVRVMQEVMEFNDKHKEADIRRNAASELVILALNKWRSRKLRSDNISVLTIAIETSDASDQTEESDEEENSTPRLPLNHLNQNRACAGMKRSRSLDSVCPKPAKVHIMDLRGAKDRACKRSSSTTTKN
ncbi:protein phosphatase 1D [Galendromus occidentalis]|uniref:Protein phosphatase 1D n=1 Tax=Galendromus occidentalis TaxID=34638 RepID=A0AAJ6VX83_9ACAR|nr:protein phosphatase 1D [Galendromus occidentalis]